MITIPNYTQLMCLYESQTTLICRAKQKSDGKQVILKMTKQTFPDKLDIERFSREFQLLQSISSKYIIKALDLIEDKNRLIIVFEDIEGSSLLELKRIIPFSLNTFLVLAISITEGLSMIHMANIIHNDINPSNIIHNPQTGEIKIIDFGIASRVSSKTHQSDIVEGTLAYMAPEQTGRINRWMDYRSDYYALGITFYELLTGQLPFLTKDSSELIHCHIAKHPIPPHQLTSGNCPKVLSEIIMKLISKSPEERYQSSSGIKEDLRECKRQILSKGTIQSFPLGKSDITEKFNISKKLYGRDMYLNHLRFDFSQWISSDTEPGSQFQPFVTIISGYAGIGKTAFVQEFQKLIMADYSDHANHKKIIVMTGYCDRYQQNNPYTPIVKAIQDLIKQILMENEDFVSMIQRKIKKAIAPHGHYLLSIIPDMKYLIGDQSDDKISDIQPTDIQNKFHILFQNFLSVFCDHKTVFVFFIDNLQWADNASIQLIQHIILSKSIPLFFMGAYRENEISPTHSVISCFNDIAKAGISVKNIPLPPIKNDSIQELIKDTFHCDNEHASILSEVINDKTQGNPFFMTEFLQNLYEEKLIVFNHANQCWQWNIQKIRNKSITENVVDRMIHRIKQLSKESEKILKLAACIGNPFSLTILKHLHTESSHEINDLLNEAIEEGLIVQSPGNKHLHYDTHDVQYHFLHDRFQQAAYSLLSEQEVVIIHRQIGKIMQKNPSSDYQDQHIFDIVRHLNHAAQLTMTPSEQKDLIRLNLQAGKRARSSAAYLQSFDYLNTGMSLLDSKRWEPEYHDLTHSLYIEMIETCYYISDFETLNRLSGEALEKIENYLDRIKIYEIIIMASMAQNHLSHAIQTAITVLKTLHIRFPKHPKKYHVMFEIFRIRWMIAERRIENLIEHKPMTEPDKLSAMRILLLMTTASYYISPELRVLVALKMVLLSLKFGNSPISPFAYAVYGAILCSIVKQTDYGYLFGKMATALLDFQQNVDYVARTQFIINAFIRHWKEPASATLEPALICYKNGLKSGDVEFAAISVHVFCYMAFHVGRELVGLEKEMKEYSNIITSLHQQKFHLDNEMNRHCILNLMGRSSQRVLLCDEKSELTEDQLLDRLIESKDRKSIFSFYFNKLILCYFFHNFQKAVEFADQAREYFDGVIGLYLYPLFIFYDSLARLAVFTSVNQAYQKKYLKIIRANQKQMKRWANHAPMNHMHKFYLVEAEKHRVIGQDVQASDFYERAIQMANTYQFVHEEAIAYELAAKFNLLKGKSDLAKKFLLHARHCFMRWGAMAKVDHMDNRYHQLLINETEKAGFVSPKSDLTSTTSSAVFDIATVMKAAQAISTEIIFDRLLERLMKVVIENAGAQKGFLMLKNGDTWIVEAHIAIDLNAKTENERPPYLFHLTSQPLDSYPYLSHAIVNYVARTGENVMLGDATNEGLFTNDIYILNNRVRSLLCIPIKRHNIITGILYLENNYATEVFTNDRLEILQLLISQAAISIENAKFYEQLEASEKKFRNLFENAVEGIFQLTPDGHFLSANPSLATIWGIDNPKEMDIVFNDLGRDIFVHAKDRKSLIQNLLEHQQVIGFETQVYRKDQTILWISISARAVFNETNNLLYYEGSLIDITNRKKAEDEIQKLNQELEQRVEDRTRELQETLFALKNSEEKYRGLYQSSKDGIILVTRDFVIQNANQAAIDISGYSLEELKQLTVRDITPRKWIEFERDITHNQILQRGYSDEYEKEIIRKDGTLIPLAVRAWPLFDIQGNITGIWSIVRDITERKRAERLREDVERMVRHDLKTPLNGIIGVATLLRRFDKLSPDQIFKYCAIVEKSAQNILHMIEHSLDIFKMEEGVYELEPEPCNLIALFHQLNENLNSLKSAGNLELNFILNGAPLTWKEEYIVMGEEVQLSNMFANLFKNALEASPDNHTVTVTLNNLQNEHEVIIHNMGVIPESIRDHFFDRYATSGKSGGTGLGTYSALLIANIHGGSITFSTSEKHGTSLFVRLPKNDNLNDSDFNKSDEKTLKKTDDDLNYKTENLQELTVKSEPETQVKKVLIMSENPIHRMTIQLFLDELKIPNDFACHYEDCFKDKPESYGVIFIDISKPECQIKLEHLHTCIQENIKRDESPLIIGFHSTPDIDWDWQSAGIHQTISLNGLTANMIINMIKNHMPSQDNKRILLAEDNSINRQVLMDMLDSFHVSFDIAETGIQAVEAAQKSTYDAILMDIQMPRMDGIDATKKIRQLESYKNIPIIAITAHNRLEENDPCIKAGMNDFISKPFQLDNINRVMKQWLGMNNQLKNQPKESNHSDLPDALPGIFVREALDRTLGNKKALLNLLETFTEQYETIHERISHYLITQTDKAIEEAHSLKGAAANLSMLDLSKVSSDIEEAIQNQSASINDLLELLKEKVTIVLGSIKTINQIC